MEAGRVKDLMETLVAVVDTEKCISYWPNQSLCNEDVLRLNSALG